MIKIFDQKYDCCGCTACKGICPQKAINMIPDEEGFLYPEIDSELCIDCNLCKEVCAFQNGYDSTNNFEPPDVYAVKHKSDEIRKRSSSGGAFTAISDYVLSQSGVVYGAAFDKELHIVHRRAETADERNDFCGSKYVQSQLGTVFQQIKDELQKKQYVLFTGTGCQVAGLKKYLAKEKSNTDTLITMDIICRGVSSPMLFSDFIFYLQKKYRKKVVQFSFRSKVKGWEHTEEAMLSNGKRDHDSELSQVYKYLYNSNMCLRPSCHQCKYSNSLRPGDITVGDFWGIEKYYHEFEDSLGVSLIMVNTPKGETVFSKITDVKLKTSNIHECKSKQTHLSAPAPINSRRNAFWNDYKKYGFDYIAKKYTAYGCKNQKVKRILLKIQRHIKKK